MHHPRQIDNQRHSYRARSVRAVGAVLATLVGIGPVVLVPAPALAATTRLAVTHIYWANASANTIGAADLDGTHVDQSFITGASGPSEVLASGKYLYWGNATACSESGACNGSIGRAALNGTDVNEHFIAASTPYGLAVHGQYIYWSGWGTGTIGRADLNGTNVDPKFITGLNAPDGVVVDGQKIYWANNGTNSIGEADLDGANVNLKFITGAKGPEGMAIDSQYIYWANVSDSSIGRADLEGTHVNEGFVARAGSYPTRVTVYGHHIYWSTWTALQVPSTGSIGRADLDGTDVNNNFIYSANSPVGVTVSPSPVSFPGGAAHVAIAARCQPVIEHVSSFKAVRGPDVTITGKCFGTGGAYTDGDSRHFRVTDLGPHGTLKELEEAGSIPQTWWNACAGHTDAVNGYSPNVVTCTVPVWTNTSITFRSFGPAYSEDGWTVSPGDKIVVQVWNANTLAGPSMFLLTAVGGTGITGGSGGSGARVISGGGGSYYPGTDHFGAGHRLLPSPLGEGQCVFQGFSDGSYQAQIAVYEANCNQADATGRGAPSAGGRAYNADGFRCAATAEGAGSEWASAWKGTYYAYDCTAGAAQVAFNWGPHYGY